MPSLLLGLPNKREGEQENLHTFSDNTICSLHFAEPIQNNLLVALEHLEILVFLEILALLEHLEKKLEPLA